MKNYTERTNEETPGPPPSRKAPLQSPKSFLLLTLVPLLMGLVYVAVIFPRYCDDPSFILEHAIVLFLWIVATRFLVFALEKPFSSAKTRLFIVPLSLVPAVSYYLLYLIYVCSVIGNIAWGEIPTLYHALKFLPYLLQVAPEFNFPASSAIGILAAPFILLVALFELEGFGLTAWFNRVKTRWDLFKRWSPGTKLAVLAALWAAGFLLVAGADTSVANFGNFNHDPVVCFLKSRPGHLPMTRERIFWARRDKKAEASLEPGIPRVRNIFVICVDALRADHLPLYGYKRPVTPFLSGFLPSAHPRKMDWGLSNGIETFNGVMSIVTSKEPGIPSQYSLTLPDLLSSQGFKTSLIMAGDHHWYLADKLFGRKIDSVTDGSDNPGPDGICDDELVVNAVSSLPPDDGTRHFFYIHLLSVHQSGAFQDRFKRYKPSVNFSDPLFKPDHPKTRLEEQSIVNMYDNRVLQMDNALKRVLMLLRDKGYLRDYAAVLTADHGQLLGERGQYGHGYYSPVGGIHIPMVFFGSRELPKFPETRLGVQLDIAPTLLDIAGLNIPFSWQGQSLARKRLNPWSCHLSPSTRPGAEGSIVYFDQGKILKYSRLLEGRSDGESEWLYELNDDPREAQNLIFRFDPYLLAQMRSQANLHFLRN